jgi:endonuclease/exonuclease/phosphatase family metal-dependent hydrolase
VRLISWNIQWCRGMDGRVDPARVAATARALADPDVCCFQEVACNFDTLEGSAGEDQATLLAAAFPEHSAHVAWAVDVPDGRGGRRRFGNLILSRLPVERVRRHALPWPSEDGVPSMARVALEADVLAPWGPVAVTTTHLEYYSARQRAAQVARLRELDTERAQHARAVPSEAYTSGPFAPLPRPRASILSGDFNMRPEDPVRAPLLETWKDAWLLAHPGRPHPPSFHVHDAAPGVEPYCCDFVLVSEDLAPRVAAVHVEAATQASDHQPVIVEFRS